MHTTLGESNYYFENIHGPDLFLLFSDTYSEHMRGNPVSILQLQRNQRPSLGPRVFIFINIVGDIYRLWDKNDLLKFGLV